MQVEAALFFETPEQLYARVFRRLKPRTPLPEIRIQFKRYANADSRVALMNGVLQVQISDMLEGAPAPVQEALAVILLGKLYRKPPDQKALAVYRRYLNRADVRRTLHLVKKERGRKLFKHIISQSGGQFPVAGGVYEDMEGDGFMKAYCFRDGVTVRVDGVEHRTTAPLTEAELDAALHGRVTRVYTYARIASTSPNDYKAAGGTVGVGDNTERKPAWLDVVRGATVRAWRTGQNDLIAAWLTGHPDF